MEGVAEVFGEGAQGVGQAIGEGFTEGAKVTGETLVEGAQGAGEAVGEVGGELTEGLAQIGGEIGGEIGEAAADTAPDTTPDQTPESTNHKDTNNNKRKRAPEPKPEPKKKQKKDDEEDQQSKAPELIENPYGRGNTGLIDVLGKTINRVPGVKTAKNITYKIANRCSTKIKNECTPAFVDPLGGADDKLESALPTAEQKNIENSEGVIEGEDKENVVPPSFLESAEVYKDKLTLPAGDPDAANDENSIDINEALTKGGNALAAGMGGGMA